MGDQQTFDFFVHMLCGYANNYAKKIENGDTMERQFGGVGFGHADDLNQAVRARQLWTERLVNGCKDFKTDDFTKARELAIEAFDYDRELRQTSDDGVRRRVLVKNFCDRDEIASLIDEAIDVACGRQGDVVPVHERFGCMARPFPQMAVAGRLNRYKRMLG